MDFIGWIPFVANSVRGVPARIIRMPAPRRSMRAAEGPCTGYTNRRGKKLHSAPAVDEIFFGDGCSYSIMASRSPWLTGVERMIWVLVVPSFWNCKMRCSSWGMLPQLTLMRKV